MFSRFISCWQNFLIQVSKFHLEHCQSKSIRKFHGFRPIFSDNDISFRPSQPTILYRKSSKDAFFQTFFWFMEDPIDRIAWKFTMILPFISELRLHNKIISSSCEKLKICLSSSQTSPRCLASSVGAFEPVSHKYIHAYNKHAISLFSTPTYMSKCLSMIRTTLLSQPKSPRTNFPWRIRVYKTKFL